MKKITLSLLTASFLLGIVLLSPKITLAENPGGGGVVTPPGGGGVTKVEATIDNPFKFGNNSTLMDYLKAIIDNIIIPIGGIIAVLAFIYSGFLYVIAQGNPTKISQANTALLYTAIGTAVLLGAAAAAKIIENTINQLQ